MINESCTPRDAKGILIDVIKKMKELNGNRLEDIIIPLSIKDSWHNVVIGASTLTTYINSPPNEIFLQYTGLKHSLLSNMSDVLINELIYTIVIHYEHILVAYSGEVDQLLYHDGFNYDAFIDYTESIYDMDIIQEIVDALNAKSGSRDYDVDAMIDNVTKCLITG